MSRRGTLITARTSAGLGQVGELAGRDYGRIDVLVNKAGWDKVGPFVDSDPADWDRVVQIDLYGVLNTRHPTRRTTRQARPAA